MKYIDDSKELSNLISQTVNIKSNKTTRELIKYEGSLLNTQEGTWRMKSDRGYLFKLKE